MKIGLFTGTFDPPTLGHLDIIKRASLFFDKLYVAVYTSSSKRAGLLKVEDRIQFLEEITSEMPNVEVTSFSSLAVDLANTLSAHYIVRGIRNNTDFDIESQMAAMNKQLTGIETLFLVASPAYAHLSSTLIREIAASGHSLKGLVPHQIEDSLSKKLHL